MSLTDEQTNVINAVCDRDLKGIVAVNAVAGSGKTFTCHECIKAFNPKNGIYTAFNKAIIDDSKKKFGKLIGCQTMHSIAFNIVKPSKAIEGFTYHHIKESISYDDKQDIISTLDDFYRSDSLDVYDYVSHTDISDTCKELVCQYADKMLGGYINPTFNFLLKKSHLLMATGAVDIRKDLVILDECQDTTAVALEIFKLINAEKKLILGDKYQNIYSFMHTVNAFDLLDNLNTYPLTQSFRCNETIADIVEDYGNQYLHYGFIFKGVNKPLSGSFKEAYLTRTNGELLSIALDRYLAHKSFSFIRDIKELFELPILLVDLKDNKPVSSTKYKFLIKEHKKYIKNPNGISFFNYLIQTVNDPNVNSAIDLILRLQKEKLNIFEVKDWLLRVPKHHDIVIATAHSMKGLEADKVIIADDFRHCIDAARECIARLYEDPEDSTFFIDNVKKYMPIEHIENLNCFYVALSRAKYDLENYDIF